MGWLGLPALFVLGGVILGWVAAFKLLHLRRELAEMRSRVDALAHEVARLAGGEAAREAAPEAGEAGARRAPEPAARPAPEPGMPETHAPGKGPESGAESLAPARPSATEEVAPGEPAAVEAAAVEDSGGLPPPPAAPAGAEPPGRRVEEALAARWLVWLGGVAVALGAAFLFVHAVEQGWLGPPARVALGLLLGAVLIAVGEWTLRRSAAPSEEAPGPDYVPPALTASGLFALYASLFAAHGAFGLIGPAPAFAALAATSFAALVLALRQGWFVGALGIAGGYLVPALIESAAPAPLPVFLYLFALTAGALWVIRYRRWPFLALAAVTGAAAWPAVWLAGPWRPGDEGVLGVFGVASAALFLALPARFAVPATGAAWRDRALNALADTGIAGAAAQGAVLILFALRVDFSPAAFVFLGLYATVGLGAAMLRGARLAPALATAALTALGFLLVPTPPPPLPDPELLREGITDLVASAAPGRFSPAAVTFLIAAGVIGMLHLAGGLALMRLAAIRDGGSAERAVPAGAWAALAVAMPLYLMALAYWRVGSLERDFGWGLAAAALSGLFVAVAAALPRLLPPAHLARPLAAFAAAATAALALAFAAVLREAWLTVAVALEAPAIAWIAARTGVRELRMVLGGVAGVVIARLAFNPWVLDYEGGTGALFGWVLWGYGVPALAFLGAAKLTGRAAEDRLAALLAAAAAGFAFLMVAFQLRLWTAGSLRGAYRLEDMVVQTLWWLTAAGLLLHPALAGRLPWARRAGLALVGLASAQILLGHLLAENPLLVATPIGDRPVVNLLAAAYLLPAAGLALLAIGRFALPGQLRPWLAGGATLLAFVHVTLEVRRAFRGPVIAFGYGPPLGDAESYAYSAAWLGFALALLAAGVLARSAWPRYASLAVIMVTVAKVFLYDMRDLTGLWRVASFLGLGLALIGIGWIYRRYVLAPRR